MNEFDYTSLVFAAGFTAGATLDLLLLRTYLAPPFRIWPTPEPGSWQSLTFWGLFRGGMVLTFVVALLDWNSAGLLAASRFLIGLPLFLVGFGITVFGYFNLGLGNTYCGADGLVSHGLYRFSRNPQYASSIAGLAGVAICANSWLTLPLAALMSGAYVLMALVEEAWLEQRYGAPYRDYCSRTARFVDIPELFSLIERKKPSRQTS
ncbi:MAG TPA: PEMT/PEM2 methyltransferase family protein [Methyloceanibacter sp.]|jgi:protein-S-isoprenylcysteine O-methyltransferase Ste14|nr:PEMT/PEM2 methyltransferase family protein [Methyloceanibacter sp.]